MPVNYENYPADWKTRIRPAIIERAGNCCEGSPGFPGCRAANGMPHPITGSTVVLTIAHLDHNTKNNNFDNLRAWCQLCHTTHDQGYHSASRKYGRDHRGSHQLKMF